MDNLVAAKLRLRSRSRNHGKGGYKINILQVFGQDAKGAKLPPQLWQQNLQSHTYFYLLNGTTFKAERIDGLVLADTTNIPGKTALKVTDTLEMTIKPGQTPLFITQFVNKTLGSNKVNTKLPTPPRQPWLPTADQAAVLAAMQGPRESLATFYNFVDKAKIDAAHATGTITDDQYAWVKEDIAAAGLGWGDLPAQFEKLQVGALANWSFP